MSVKVIKVKGEKVLGTYVLNKKEFIKFMTMKLNTAKAIKEIKESEGKAE